MSSLMDEIINCLYYINHIKCRVAVALAVTLFAKDHLLIKFSRHFECVIVFVCVYKSLFIRIVFTYLCWNMTPLLCISVTLYVLHIQSIFVSTFINPLPKERFSRYFFLSFFVLELAPNRLEEFSARSY